MNDRDDPRPSINTSNTSNENISDDVSTTFITYSYFMIEFFDEK